VSEWADKAHFFFGQALLRGDWVVSMMSTGSSPVQAAIERTVGALGFDLVDLEFAGRGLLRVFIDLSPERLAAARAEGQPEGVEPMIRVEDCEQVSHQLTHVLTVENIDYSRLEVSSPGMDRPLRRAADYERFTGSEVSLRLRVPLKGRRNFSGVLLRDEAQPGGWVLELSAQQEPAGKPGAGKGARSAKAGKAAGKPGSVAKAAKDLKGTVGAQAPGAQEAQTVERLSFVLEDVERARLVPQVKF
jgi:ribosome maturation factor RimP